MRKLIILCYLFLNISVCYAQHIMVSGVISDSLSGKRLPYATCYDILNNDGVLADEYGNFSYNTENDSAVIVFSYIGYIPDTSVICKNRQKLSNLQINLKNRTINDVVVYGKSMNPIDQSLLGVTSISNKKLESMPAPFGEPDIIRALTKLPGVSAGKEGMANMYVRGGNHDQNLILIDDIPLLSNTHFSGLYSAVSPDVVNRIDFYKGGFPARFGGKASSVIDIISNDGGNHFKGDFKIGLTHSTVNLEGPVNDKINYFFSARTAYLDLITTPALWISQNKEKIFRKSRDVSNVSYENSNYFHLYFYDTFLKVRYKHQRNNNIYLTFYSGDDLFKVTDQDVSYKDKISYNMFSLSLGLKHTKKFNEKLFLKNTFIHTRYKNKVGQESEDSENAVIQTNLYQSQSTYNRNAFKSLLRYQPNNNHTFKTGVQMGAYHIEPMKYSYEDATNTDSLTYSYSKRLGGNRDSYYMDFFLEDEYKIFSKLTINAGLRVNNYFVEEVSFHHLDPRFSVRYKLNSRLALKAGYTLTQQYTHALTRSDINLQDNIWVLSTKDIPPIRARQVSGGIFFSALNSRFNSSIEVFHKKMDHLIDYSAVVINNPSINNWENLVTKNGKGISYGLETSQQFSFNDLIFDFHYTLSWNNRKFPGINSNNWYPGDFDSRHYIDAIANYTFRNNNMLSVGFNYQSGRAVTLANTFVPGNEFSYQYYASSSVNNYRLRPYHRLDISYKTFGTTKKGRKYELNYSVYNAYLRKNASTVYYQNNKLYEKSLLLFVPSISYKLYFNKNE